MGFFFKIIVDAGNLNQERMRKTQKKYNTFLSYARSINYPRRIRGGIGCALAILIWPLIAGICGFWPPPVEAAATHRLLTTQPGFTARDIAVIINDRSPMSRRIGEYYQKARNIPTENIVRIRFEFNATVMSPGLFNRLIESVEKQTPESVQAYVLTWSSPYRVGCMSITTAFAAGYNEAFCADKCSRTLRSPYYNSDSKTPYNDYGWRPTIALAGSSYENVKELIDRGIRSDHTFPTGAAYLLTTSDRARSSRSGWFPAIKEYFGNFWDVRLINADTIRNKTDVMFYFTGLKTVPDIKSNRYLPGAIADHLTSAGGQLTDSRQMSILRWLEAGVTGSYGAVVEPCNFPQKFPHPGIVMLNYLRGSSLIEAYWKSVAWPGQGIFVGEPLAKPFGTTPPR